MKKDSFDKKLVLKNLQKERNEISRLLESGELTKTQLLTLFSFPSEYGLNPNVGSYGSKVKKEIYNSPFLLCDQEHLNPKVRGPLEVFLNDRYVQELEELSCLFNDSQIGVDEYLEQCDFMKFCYYESSSDGQKILEKKRYR